MFERWQSKYSSVSLVFETGDVAALEIIVIPSEYVLELKENESIAELEIGLEQMDSEQELDSHKDREVFGVFSMSKLHHTKDELLGKNTPRAMKERLEQLATEGAKVEAVVLRLEKEKFGMELIDLTSENIKTEYKRVVDENGFQAVRLEVDGKIELRRETPFDIIRALTTKFGEEGFFSDRD